MRKGFFLWPILLALMAIAFLPATSYAASSNSLMPHHAAHVLSQQAQQSQKNAQTPQGNVSYHNGPVVSGTMNVYAIFWEPSGSSVSSNYNSLIERYFNDVGNSPLYQNNQQYTGNGAAPTTSVLAGSFVDTDSYPGTPLLDSNIQSEISHVQSAEGWQSGTNNVFFVFTAENENLCMDSTQTLCTSNTHQTFCGYHNYFNTNTIYAAIPYAASFYCNAGASPNSDDADQAINVTSREQMNVATDPLLNGWYDSNKEEIGDKCAWTFAPLNGQGYDVTWNNDSYLVQEEWNNEFNACTLGKIATPPPTYYQLVNRNSGKVLEVYHSATNAGATVDQWDNNGSYTQQWKLVPDGNYYQLVNRNSGKVLEVFHSATNAGATVDQWDNNGSNTQQWSLVADGSYDQLVNRNSGKVLEVFHSATNAGATVDQWDNNGSNTQQWSLVPVTTTPVTYYHIVNRNSGQVLEVLHSSTSAGATVDQWTDNGSSTQEWGLVPDGSSYQLVNRNSGQVLEILHSAFNAGAPSDQWPNNGSNTQQWNLVPAGGNFFHIVDLNSGMVLEILHSSTSAGAVADQWADNGSYTQEWSLVPVAS